MQPDGPQLSSGNGKGKLRLLTRSSLDGRTRARKRWDAIVGGIASDLGGEDQLSTVQRFLIEAFASVAIQLDHLNVRVLRGESVDLLALASVVSSMTRVASRIGIDRVPRNVTPTLTPSVAIPKERIDEVDLE